MRSLEDLRSQLVQLDPACTVTLRNWDMRVSLPGTIVDFDVRALLPEADASFDMDGDTYTIVVFEVVAFLGDCPKLDPDTALQYAAEAAKLATRMIAARRLVEEAPTAALLETRKARETREAADRDGKIQKADMLAIAHVITGMRVGQQAQYPSDSAAEGERKYTLRAKSTSRTYTCTTESGVITVVRTA